MKYTVKDAIKERIQEYERLKESGDYNSEIEQNAIYMVLKELRELDEVVEYEILSRVI